MSEREGPWPADGDLRELVREAGEHRRTWALVGGLSTRLLQERKAKPASTEEQASRIHGLEQKIVKQKAALRNLEECRAFERETERLLVQALDDIRNAPSKASMLIRANDAQVVHAERKGPRPEGHTFPVVDLTQ